MEQQITNYIDSLPMESLAAFGGVIIGLCAVLLAIAIFAIVCNCKIYKKMGAPAWAAIVPYYSTWVMYEKIWCNTTMPIIVLALSLIPAFVDLGVLEAGMSLATVVLALITNWKMYKYFGKGTGFCILAIFFPIITLPIIAFGSAEFNRPESI